MFFAPIAPPALVDFVPPTRYNLVLSNELLQHPKLLQHYKRAVRMNDFVILDNPVREKLPIPPMTQLVALALTLQPTVATCPDTLDDAKTTMKQWLENKRGPLATVVPLMAVAQGRSETELRACLSMQAETGAKYLGFPRTTFRDAGWLRDVAIRDLTREGFFKRHPQVLIHLLGADHDFRDVLPLVGHEHVLGCDSAKPIYLAMAGRAIDTVAPDEEIHRPPEFFTFGELDVTPAITNLVRYNVDTAVRWLDGS